MDSTGSWSKKGRKYAKSKKKSWKKYSDIQDVEEYLDDKRLQERTGGIAAEKKDEDLFFVDAAPKQQEDKVPEKTEKTLRCHSHLLPDPNTKALIIVDKKPDESSKKKRSSQVLAKEEQGFVSAKRRQSQNDRSATLRRKAQIKLQKQQKNAPARDLWEDDLDMGIDKHYLKETKQYQVKAPKWHKKKPTQLAQVEVAHPGASYNPTYTDHQDLLRKAVAVETAKEKKTKRLNAALDNKASRGFNRDREWFLDMSQGLDDGQPGEDEEVEGDVEKTSLSLSCGPPVRREDKKTPKQRRKQKAHKVLEAKIKMAKDAKLRKHKLLRVKAFEKEADRRQLELAAKTQRHIVAREEGVNKTKRLGKLKYEAPDVELKLTEELVGSLRCLKPEGSVMEDRFKSLQKRNIIEPRLPAKYVRRYKPKVYTLRSHSDITE